MQRAKVFRNNIFVGLLTKLNEKQYVFVYDKEYLTIATTEKRYVDKNKDHAQKALDKFTSATTLLLEEEIIDVEVVEDNFLSIKKLFPNATDEQIKKAIAILVSDNLDKLK
ncbi:hypothetical protein [Aliarcobacter butzleri]|uniref:hypothetical protein n=1 Tax=Aliarcobacter butzleri TaxID=28197 RepID=UPI002B23F95A|nr:hypothetical protein [Aliarcobacter butzleri]